MTLADALEIVITRTGHERYRYLCLDHPDPAVRAQYSAWVIAQASGEPMTPVKGPSLLRKARNFGKAAVRFVASGLATTPADVQAARRAICDACDRVEVDSDECRECGCPLARKIPMASEACPLGKWPAVKAVKAAKCGGCGAKAAQSPSASNTASS